MQRPRGNLHILNKPNKGLINVNKSILIGLRGGLVWGLKTQRELEKRPLRDLRFSVSSSPCLHDSGFLLNTLCTVFLSTFYTDTHELAVPFRHPSSPLLCAASPVVQPTGLVSDRWSKSWPCLLSALLLVLQISAFSMVKGDGDRHHAVGLVQG
jgi:hypothetical protein